MKTSTAFILAFGAGMVMYSMITTNLMMLALGEAAFVFAATKAFFDAAAEKK